MTRVLYWNVQNFGINKLNQLGKKRDINGNKLPTPESGYRTSVMRSVLTNNPPDIFVLVETQTGNRAAGTLISQSGGANGAKFLLDKIRNWLAPTWMLVPPLVLGTGGVTEGISVYYNSANLNFTGPWGWLGGNNPAGPPGNLVNYPNFWYNAGGWKSLPTGNTPGGGNNINANTPYRQLAGKWKFTDNNAAQIDFPNNWNRTPFLTTFWDPNNNRTIKLLSFHASPKKGQAANGTNNLSDIPEMVNLGMNEVGVIVGDFNVNLYNTYYEPIAYNNLINVAGYTRHLNPTNNNQFPDKGYVSTMLKSVKNARPWNTNGYPGYGYTITDSYTSVDNILTKYGGGVNNATNFTIVNPVATSPYNLVVNALPQGHYVYPTAMQNTGGGRDPDTLPLPPNGPGGGGGVSPVGGAGALKTFQGWASYRRVRSTSDHLPLIIDI